MPRRKPASASEAPSAAERWLGRLVGREGVSVSRRSALREWLDDCSEALALAEANEQGLAGDVLRRESARKIVVLGTGPGFSKALGEHALGLAERLSCDLVFLSVGSSDVERAPRRRETFTAAADQAASAWLDAAKRRGLAATHEARFGEPVDVVEQLCATLRRVEFVLGEAGDTEGFKGRLSRPLFVVR